MTGKEIATAIVLLVAEDVMELSEGITQQRAQQIAISVIMRQKPLQKALRQFTAGEITRTRLTDAVAEALIAEVN